MLLHLQVRESVLGLWSRHRLRFEMYFETLNLTGPYHFDVNLR